MSKQLTTDSFMDLWKRELLPTIRKEIASQINEIKVNFEAITERLKNIEQSQEFLASKYDQLTESLQITKKQISQVENKFKKQEESYSSNKERMDVLFQQLDETQQYSRRDCLEISGIPKLDDDQPAQLITEIAELIGASICKEDISVAHRLPDTKSTKNRIIVKLVRREKKDQLYAKRSRLNKITSARLPSMQAAGIRSNERIYINESLTPYRKRLLRAINQYKKENHYKYLWTVNGKIFLKEHETSRAQGFTTEEDFNKFVAGH